MSEPEDFLRRFHAEHPGSTARAFARGGSYEALARLVPRDGRILDLACGDGVMLADLPNTTSIEGTKVIDLGSVSARSAVSRR